MPRHCKRRMLLDTAPIFFGPALLPAQALQAATAPGISDRAAASFTAGS